MKVAWRSISEEKIPFALSDRWSGLFYVKGKIDIEPAGRSFKKERNSHHYLGRRSLINRFQDVSQTSPPNQTFSPHEPCFCLNNNRPLEVMDSWSGEIDFIKDL